MKRFCILLSLILATQSPASITTSDAWDVSNGAVVLSHSTTSYGDITNMLGNNLSDPFYGEEGFTLFADFEPQGFVHFLEWKTSSSIILNGYVLNLADDQADLTGNRGISSFNLYGRVGDTGTWTLLDSFSPSSNPYGELEHVGNFASFEANYFRAEFIQYSAEWAGGPRVAELDAITVPEASTSLSLSALGMALLARRRRLQTSRML